GAQRLLGTRNEVETVLDSGHDRVEAYGQELCGRHPSAPGCRRVFGRPRSSPARTDAEHPRRALVRTEQPSVNVFRDPNIFWDAGSWRMLVRATCSLRPRIRSMMKEHECEGQAASKHLPR